MNRLAASIVYVIATSLCVLCPSPLPAQSPDTQALIEFNKHFDVKAVETQDATVTLVNDGQGPRLRIATGHAADWPGVTLKAPQEVWDLAGYAELSLDVKNLGTKSVSVHCRVDSPGGDGVQNSLTEHVTVESGEQKTLKVRLAPRLPADLADRLFGMRGYPGGATKQGIDTSRVTQLIIFLNRPDHDHVFELGEIQVRGTAPQPDVLSMAPDEFFPMIDEFGQFRHREWPGKTGSIEDLRASAERELSDLAAQPGPDAWNQYGGWAGGPQLKATGFFYPSRHAGKWWLVDPDGRLFWSHGVDCVGTSQGTTPISDREYYFSWLPDEESPFAAFYGRASWAPHGYYHEKGAYRTFNFTAANLMRKYGDNWFEPAAERAHLRLRSWSMNTIGNWSDSGIYLRHKTPYVVPIGSSGAKRIEGSMGYWGKFPDPFDPSFRRELDRRLRGERGRSAGDPWCIGYFVDNELAWGDELSLAVATLKSPADQAAKQAFVADLKRKYESIECLNDAWETSHESWSSLAESRTAPDPTRAGDDLGAFYDRIAEEYFRQCREGVKQVAPNNLYLGCRFAWVNDRGARAAAKYCDVIGYNLYRDDVSGFELPQGLDKPVIIGEFHFGALDRGLFHTGLRPTADQRARAAAYRHYVTGALKNPYLVGTHWFQFGDQATTGRGDGENYQIGLVDICDTPYAETIQAIREVGREMYRIRWNAGPTHRAK